jgi:hypothetical protein
LFWPDIEKQLIIFLFDIQCFFQSGSECGPWTKIIGNSCLVIQKIHLDIVYDFFIYNVSQWWNIYWYALLQGYWLCWIYGELSLFVYKSVILKVPQLWEKSLLALCVLLMSRLLNINGRIRSMLLLIVILIHPTYYVS